jgi:GT2 family glycosyltransferase/glycosyltransferase involved in cell wall biosynthesis
MLFRKIYYYIRKKICFWEGFDEVWYRETYKDLESCKVTPYEHFVIYGKKEGRKPSSGKRGLGGMSPNQIKLAKLVFRALPFPLSSKESLKKLVYSKFPSLPIALNQTKDYLSSIKGNVTSIPKNQILSHHHLDTILSRAKLNFSARPDDFIVDVIVPVYRGLEQTRRCIESVLNSKNDVKYRLIVINDCSPEPEINQYLKKIAGSGAITYLENNLNLGFTETVNRGMQLSGVNDVLLLNSDTEVANNWLDRLVLHAYSKCNVGTVTPFSNNATICNYPTLAGMSIVSLPVNELDVIFQQANSGKYIEIPTAVGFCMFIKRRCLDEVGLFDVEAFGRGYGEENDFCLRASSFGWLHHLAGDTFVFHEGEVSFKEESSPSKARAEAIILGRYPEYSKTVTEHITKNEAFPLRVAAIAQSIKTQHDEIILCVLHAYGGGTEKYVKETYDNEEINLSLRTLFVKPYVDHDGAHYLHLYSNNIFDFFDIYISQQISLPILGDFLRLFGITQVSIQHLMGYQLNWHSLLKYLKVPYSVLLHDYYYICPRAHLWSPLKERYCGLPSRRECNQCLSVDMPLGISEISWWREKNVGILECATQVVCPSNDVKNRFEKIFNHLSYEVKPHQESSFFEYTSPLKLKKLGREEALRVVVIGVISLHKGSSFLMQLSSICKKKKYKIKIHLIGFCEFEKEAKATIPYTQTGPYKNEDLFYELEKFNPHLALFLPGCPETYSYTLSETLASGLPIIAPSLGAYIERLDGRAWTWLYSYKISPDDLIDQLLIIRSQNFANEKAPEPLKLLSKSNLPELLSPSEIPAIVAMRSKKIKIAILIEMNGFRPSPCAYIRIIIPLISEKQSNFEYFWVTAEELRGLRPDVLICQRTAGINIEVSQAIFKYCDRYKIKVIFDLDDLLINLPESHPEFEIYDSQACLVRDWISRADQVWVSTLPLMEQLKSLNPTIKYLPNVPDFGLWKPMRSDHTIGDLDRIVRILYMGTASHYPDFKMIEPVLRRIKKEFGALVEINLLGVAPSAVDGNIFKVIDVPSHVGVEYPAFVLWVQKFKFDIGLAPLVDNIFNRCKSEIKYSEYTAMGMATIASNLNGYDLIKHKQTGLLVDNDENSWYEAISMLIEDPRLRSAMAENALNHLLDDQDKGTAVVSRANLITNVIDRSEYR